MRNHGKDTVLRLVDNNQSATTKFSSRDESIARDFTPSGIHRLLLFRLQLLIVVFQENFDLVGVIEQSVPLLLVKRNGKSAESVD